MARLAISIISDGTIPVKQELDNLVFWTGCLVQAGFRASLFGSSGQLQDWLCADEERLMSVMRPHDCGLALAIPAEMRGQEESRVLRARRWWQARLRQILDQAAKEKESVSRLLGTTPVAAIAASGWFVPQLPLALSRIGIPVLAQAPFEGRRRGEPLRYCGGILVQRQFAAFDLLSIPARKRPDLPRLLSQSASAGFFLLQINIARAEYGDAAFRRRIAPWLQTLRQASGIAPARLTDLAGGLVPARRYDGADIRALAGQITPCLSPVFLDGVTLSLSEVFYLLVQFGAAMSGGKAGDENRYFRLPILGPLLTSPPLGEVLTRREVIFSACVSLLADMRCQGHLPAVVAVGGYRVSPSAFLYALARLLREDSAGVHIPAGILPQRDAGRKAVRVAAESQGAAWPIPQESSWVRQSILQQCWTATDL